MFTNLLMLSVTCFAQAPAQPTAPGSTPGGQVFQFMLVLSMMLIAMYLLFVLPKQSQAKKAQKLIDSLKKGDRVMTTSGMIGTIFSVDKEAGEVVLTVDNSNNTKIKFSTAAIYFVYQNKDENVKKD